MITLGDAWLASFIGPNDSSGSICGQSWSRAGLGSPAGRSLKLGRVGRQQAGDGLDQPWHTDDRDRPLHVIGKHVQRHLRGDVLLGLHFEVCGPHPGFDGAEGMFNRFAAHRHLGGIVFQPPLGFLQLVQKQNLRMCWAMPTYGDEAELHASGALLLLDALDVKYEFEHSCPNGHLPSVGPVLATLLSLVSSSPNRHRAAIAVGRY